MEGLFRRETWFDSPSPTRHAVGFGVAWGSARQKLSSASAEHSARKVYHRCIRGPGVRTACSSLSPPVAQRDKDRHDVDGGSIARNTISKSKQCECLFSNPWEFKKLQTFCPHFCVRQAHASPCHQDALSTTVPALSSLCLGHGSVSEKGAQHTGGISRRCRSHQPLGRPCM